MAFTVKDNAGGGATLTVERRCGHTEEVPHASREQAERAGPLGELSFCRSCAEGMVARAGRQALSTPVESMDDLLDPLLDAMARDDRERGPKN